MRYTERTQSKRDELVSNRVNVFVDGVKVGWVTMNRPRDWSGHTLRSSTLTADRLFEGAGSQDDAVYELLSGIRIWNLGWVKVPGDWSQGQYADQDHFVDQDELKRAAEAVLDRKYRVRK